LGAAVAKLPLLFGTDVLESLDVIEKRSQVFETICDAFGLDMQQTLAEVFSRTELALAADVITPENFANELAVRERLEGSIDRCVPRIVQLKLSKRMLALPETQRQPRSKLRRVPKYIPQPKASVGIQGRADDEH
jgi:hypothetical protein